MKPAGKRIEALSLLSGGEKALTAIAFLFALLLTKPSPFYVLDEVEAALDDANIERFLDLLRAYQDRPSSSSSPTSGARWRSPTCSTG